MHLIDEMLFSRLFDGLDIVWCIASSADWDAPEDVRREIQRRLAVIVNGP